MINSLVLIYFRNEKMITRIMYVTKILQRHNGSKEIYGIRCLNPNMGVTDFFVLTQDKYHELLEKKTLFSRSINLISYELL